MTKRSTEDIQADIFTAEACQEGLERLKKVLVREYDKAVSGIEEDVEKEKRRVCQCGYQTLYKKRHEKQMYDPITVLIVNKKCRLHGEIEELTKINIK